MTRSSWPLAREERLRLRGRALRFVLVNELAQHGTLTVADMVTIVRRYRFDLGGRESKIISDALRWELARGRVVKLARGVYRYGRTPSSTARRIRIFASVTAIRWMQIVAPTRTNPLPGRHSPDPRGGPPGANPTSTGHPGTTSTGSGTPEPTPNPDDGANNRGPTPGGPRFDGRDWGRARANRACRGSPSLPARSGPRGNGWPRPADQPGGRHRSCPPGSRPPVGPSG